MENTKRAGLFRIALGFACFAFLQRAGWSTTAYPPPLFMITITPDSGCGRGLKQFSL